MKYFLSLTLLQIVFFSFTQSNHYEKDLLLFLNADNVKAEEFIRWEKDGYYAKVTLAVVKVGKKIGLYELDICHESNSDSGYVCNVYNVIKPIYDKIGDFKILEKNKNDTETSLYDRIEMATLKKDKKASVVFRAISESYNHDYFEPELFFDSLNWTFSMGTQVAVSKNKKWGIYDWLNREMVLKCQFKSLDDLPKTSNPKGLNESTSELINAFKAKRIKIDYIESDTIHFDGIVKIRNQETKKWGLYQLFGELSEAIPLKYDSLETFSLDGNTFSAVYDNGKVGFYLSEWNDEENLKPTIPCIYDDFKIYVYKYQSLLAVKRNDKWGWVNWWTGEEASEFIYDTVGELTATLY